jgi:hypothetical protein
LWIPVLGDYDAGPYNILGNGAAMRIAPAGLLARSREAAIYLESETIHRRARKTRYCSPEHVRTNSNHMATAN